MLPALFFSVCPVLAGDFSQQDLGREEPDSLG